MLNTRAEQPSQNLQEFLVDFTKEPVRVLIQVDPHSFDKIITEAIRKNQLANILKPIESLYSLIVKLPERSDELFDLCMSDQKLANLFIKSAKDIFFYLNIFFHKKDLILTHLLKHPVLLEKILSNSENLTHLIKYFPEKNNNIFNLLLNKSFLKKQNVLSALVNNFPDQFIDIFLACLDNLSDILAYNAKILFYLSACYSKASSHFAISCETLLFSDCLTKNLFPLIIEQLDLSEIKDLFLVMFANQKNAIETGVFDNIKAMQTLIKKNDVMHVLFTFPKYARKILALYAEHHPESYAILDPLPFVIEQRGPNCGYNALSAITEYYTSPKLRSDSTPLTVFYPAQHFFFPNSTTTSIKKLGRTIGLTSLGGIFDLEKFKELITKVGLASEIFSIPNVENFKNLIKFSIVHRFPLILPYNYIEGTNGANAHYAIIVGYRMCSDEMKVFISQNGEYQLFPITQLFARNDELNFWPSQKFIKMGKREFYIKDLNVGIQYYKSAIEPDHDLSKTLKHRVLGIFTQEMHARLIKKIPKDFTCNQGGNISIKKIA